MVLCDLLVDVKKQSAGLKRLPYNLNRYGTKRLTMPLEAQRCHCLMYNVVWCTACPVCALLLSLSIDVLCITLFSSPTDVR